MRQPTFFIICLILLVPLVYATDTNPYSNIDFQNLYGIKRATWVNTTGFFCDSGGCFNSSNISGSAGDITAVIAGVGLTGGGLSGAVTLTVNETHTNLTIDNRVTESFLTNLLNSVYATISNVKSWISSNSTADRAYTDTRVESIVNTTDATISGWISTNVTSANDSMKIYVDAQDTIYNTSMVTHDSSTNASMKIYVDSQDSILRTHIDNNITLTESSLRDNIDTNSTFDRAYTDIRVESIVNTTEETIHGWIDTNITQTELSLRDNIDTNTTFNLAYTDSVANDIDYVNQTQLGTSLTGIDYVNETKLGDTISGIDYVNQTDLGTAISDIDYVNQTDLGIAVSGIDYINRTDLDVDYYNKTGTNETIDSKLAGNTWYFITNVTASTMVGDINLSWNVNDYDSDSFNLTATIIDYFANTSNTVTTDLNRICIRYRGVKDTFDLYLRVDGEWESYLVLTPQLEFIWLCGDIRDADEHIFDGKVNLRITGREEGLPSAQRELRVDAIYLSSGYVPTTGVEVDPESIHSDGDVPLTDNWDAGDYTIRASQFNGSWNESSQYELIVDSFKQANFTSMYYAITDRFTNSNITEAAIEALGFNITTDLETYFDTLYQAIGGSASPYTVVNFTSDYYTITSRFANTNWTTLIESYTNLTYDSELEYINNCSVTDSCENVAYQGDLVDTDALDIVNNTILGTALSDIDYVNTTIDKATNASMKVYVDSQISAIDGMVNNTDINQSNVYVQNSVYMGNSDADHFIYMRAGGSQTGESLKWDEGDDRFEFSNDLYAAGGSVTAADLISTDDIWTTGLNDDLWLGTATQSSSKFIAYADGRLTLDKFNVSVYGAVASAGNATFNGLHIDKINSTHWKLWG